MRKNEGKRGGRGEKGATPRTGEKGCRKNVLDFDIDGIQLLSVFGPRERRKAPVLLVARSADKDR